MKRQILFVDDEKKILEALQRMLRGMRNDWEMRFAEGGAEALALLAKGSFDVVVTDMRMPKMDGADLLSEIKKCYPNIVRIILSGHSEKELVLKSVSPAHQYLAKPCDAETLKHTISRACALRDLLAQDTLKGIVSQINSLPSLPSLYSELMNAMQSSDSSIQQIGQIIAKDIAMTAKVLQIVNSAFFGIPRHISNPEQAVGLLGLDTVKALILTAGVFSSSSQIRVAGFKADTLWSHSIATGAIAREIARAESMDRQDIDNAFMAGLLHDVGQLIIAAEIPAQYGEVLKKLQNEPDSLHLIEHQIIGSTHAEVGAYLLGLWGLPDAIVEAVAFHHLPGSCVAEGLLPLSIVHAADALEHHMAQPIRPMNQIARLDQEYMEKSGLTERLSTWQDICSQIMKGDMSNA